VLLVFLLLLAIWTHSSFPSVAASLPPIFEDSGSYVSAEDPNYDPTDLCDEVSALGVDDDDYTYDTETSAGFQSEAFVCKKNGNIKKNVASIQGTTSFGLPYQLDYWHDSFGRACISTQFHGTYKKTFVRLSMDQQHLVLICKVNQFLVNGSLAFETFLLDEHALNENKKVYVSS
jgi:hypothetical protein